MSHSYPHLFSSFRLRGLEIRNRILSTGHDTDLGRHGLPGEALIAYQRARAKGGVGLIIVQVVAVHETARYTSEVLMGTSDAHIAAFRPLFQAIRAEGATAFVQLFHPGRELLGRRDGILQPAYAPSSAPTERFRIVPRAFSTGEVEEIIEGYGQVARRMAEAGAEGVEIVASHGYLPTQFLNSLTNRREDRFGGSPANRLRFLEEVVGAVRRYAPPELILGLRLSGNEYEATGIEESEMLGLCRRLKDSFDYFNVIGGTSASTSGAIHIVPPMSVANGYLAPFSGALKQAIGKPVFVAGRINQPQEAERILAEGAADLCGMTRALICDPEMPNKAKAGQSEDIRACIACNQACIGHAQLGLSISCIQHPETGREVEYGARARAARPLKVIVVGGGPGGMKAAAVAAECGHRVTLYERTRRLGGQALLAQLLPHRAEFGGIVTNLAREMALAGVAVRTGVEATAALIARETPDHVIIATGTRPRLPTIEGGEGIQILHAHDVIEKRARTGQRVVIYDWLADWTGVGIAEQLAGEGVHVRLAVNAPCAAFAIQNYTRDAAIARLFKLGVEIIPFMRLYGAEAHTAYFVHTPSQESLVMEDVDTIVVVYPGEPEDALAAALGTEGIPVHLIGDALAPRTAEEAVFEGLKAATELSVQEGESMTAKKLIVIEQTDPRRPEVRELVAELDAYMQRLYPAESNHLLDVETLARPEVLFFVGRVDGESLGCGAIVLRSAEEGRHESGEAYAEVKRIYVSPRARGLSLGKKLLSHLEDAARAHRLRLICLETGVYQPEALGLFAHHGFARCRHFGDYPTDDPLSLFMDKRL